MAATKTEIKQIATALGVAMEKEVEKALLQMRSPRPETTRGTLNVTLAAHKVFMQESLRRTCKARSSPHAYSPGALLLESRLDPAVRAELGAVGHAVAGWPAFT